MDGSRGGGEDGTTPNQKQKGLFQLKEHSNMYKEKWEKVLFGPKKMYPEKGENLRIINIEVVSEIAPVSDSLWSQEVQQGSAQGTSASPKGSRELQPSPFHILDVEPKPNTTAKQNHLCSLGGNN